jgi:hypothetical protein
MESVKRKYLAVPIPEEMRPINCRCIVYPLVIETRRERVWRWISRTARDFWSAVLRLI